MGVDNLDGINEALPAIRADIERALAPGRAMADLVKAIHAPAHMIAITEIAKAMRPPTHLSVVSQMMTAMQRQNWLLSEFARPPRFVDDFVIGIAHMRAVAESITAPSRAILEMMRSQSIAFEALSAHIAAFDSAKLSIAQFTESTLALNVASIGLANRMNDVGLLAQREVLSARLFAASSVYTKFTQRTVERLIADPAPGIAARLRGSLNLAKYQLLGIADAVSGFIMLPDDEEVPDNLRDLNAPYTQQDELLACDAFEDETNTEAMTAFSPTAQTVERGRHVLELVTQCNEAGKTSAQGVEIFKPTTRLLTVFTDLPWLTSTDRFRFGDVLDCLYIIFYEGAGKDNLRFLDKHGGPLSDTDCRLIWCIKHLRNKWSRHDADHGKEKDIQKSWAQLAAEFRWLGLTEHPTDAHHFKQLHSQLLVLAEDFLRLILSKLKLRQ